MNLTEKFQTRAALFISELKTAVPVREVEEKFRQMKMLGEDTGSPQFEKIYYAYLTAQVAQRWNYSCTDQGIDSKEIQNLFFKTVLDRYAREKDIEGASHFSEAMYAANSDPEQQTIISILIAFFKKTSSGFSPSAQGNAELFQWVAGIWEGYCYHFENEFEDFLAELRLQGAVSQKKRG